MKTNLIEIVRSYVTIISAIFEDVCYEKETVFNN